MSNVERISVVINTYNAQQYLEEVLTSLTNFDEIVVCDMESTDMTVDIAKKYNCKIVIFPKGNISICEPARNYAIQSASYKWVLVVDADEVVTPELQKYLYEQISRKDCPEALRIPRRNKFLGHYTHSSPDYQTRFFQKNKVDWPPIIHHPPIINGKTENIPQKLKKLYLLHLDDSSITSRFNKLNIYSDYEVSKRIHKRYGIFTLVCRPIWYFVRCVLIQGGWKEGKRGLL